MRLFLISNSGRPFLQHCSETMLDFLGSVRTLGYITAARMDDENRRFQLAADALASFGIEAEHYKLDGNLKSRLSGSQAVLVSGGNTYALLHRLRDAGILPILTNLVRAGLPYLGTSAGTNIAGPNILATNDWNVLGCKQFDAMDLVPWAINPHYVETDPTMAPGSETRDQRIGEYLKVNETPVLAIEESTAIRVEHNKATVLGTGRAVLFERDEVPRSFGGGQVLPGSITSRNISVVS